MVKGFRRGYTRGKMSRHRIPESWGYYGRRKRLNPNIDLSLMNPLLLKALTFGSLLSRIRGRGL